MAAVCAGVLSTAAASATERANDTRPAADCASDFHARLNRDVLSKAKATLEIADELREPIKSLPGHWLFWKGGRVMARTAQQRRLLANPHFLQRAGRMCARAVLIRGGRVRCMKWQTIPKDYVAPKPVLATVDPASPEISEAEYDIAASLTPRVLSRAALDELSFGSAFYHMAKRTSDELIRYASQPLRPALCSGATEMISFYRRQLIPLSSLARNAADLARQAHKAARSTAKFALTRLTAGDGRIVMETGDEQDLRNLLRQLISQVLGESEHKRLDQSSTLLEYLEGLAEMLDDKRLAAFAKGSRTALLKALRNSEFAGYAELNHERIDRLDSGFRQALAAIGTSHATACTCRQ